MRTQSATKNNNPNLTVKFTAAIISLFYFQILRAVTGCTDYDRRNKIYDSRQNVKCPKISGKTQIVLNSTLTYFGKDMITK